MRLYKILILFCFAFPFGIFAQTTVFTADIDSIIVTVQRNEKILSDIPFSFYLIDSSNIVRINNTSSVEEYFRTIPGVNVDNRFNPSQDDKITIRGIGSRAQFGTRGIKVLLDDIPLTFPDGQTQFNNLDASQIERIEILRGPASSLYGNASGGVIAFKSKLIDKEEISSMASLKFGSFGFRKINLGLSGKILNGNSSLNLYNSVSKGFRDHSDSEMYGFNYLTNYKINKDFSINGTANYFYSPFLLNPSSLNKIDAEINPTKVRSLIKSSGSGKKVVQFQTGLSLKYRFNEELKFSTVLFGIKRNLFNAITNRVIDLDRLSYGLRTQFEIDGNLYSDSDYKILIGFDLEHQDDIRIENENEGLDGSTNSPSDILDKIRIGKELLNQNERVENKALFGNIDLKLLEDFNVSFGIRYDNFNFSANDFYMIDSKDDSGSRELSKVSPSIGVSYKLTNKYLIFTNYATAFQTPTANELSNNSNGEGGFNQSLIPENIESYELGINGRVDEFNSYFTLVVYEMFIKNMILSYQNLSDETFYRNAGQAQSRGLEFMLSTSPIKKIKSVISYNYQSLKFTDYILQSMNNNYQLAGKYVPGIPLQSINIFVGFNPYKNLSLNFNFKYTDKIYANDFNGSLSENEINSSDYINDAYTLVSFAAKYNLNLFFVNSSISFGIENLLDERYNGSVVPNAFGNNYFEPAPGRTFFAGFDFKI